MPISKLQRGRKIPLGFPKGKTRYSFFHSRDSVFHKSIRISTVVKMTECEPLPGLIHMSSQFGFLLGFVSLIFGG